MVVHDAYLSRSGRQRTDLELRANSASEHQFITAMLFVPEFEHTLPSGSNYKLSIVHVFGHSSSGLSHGCDQSPGLRTSAQGNDYFRGSDALDVLNALSIRGNYTVMMRKSMASIQF
jgi:hypothetical protein